MSFRKKIINYSFGMICLDLVLEKHSMTRFLFYLFLFLQSEWVYAA